MTLERVRSLALKDLRKFLCLKLTKMTLTSLYPWILRREVSTGIVSLIRRATGNSVRSQRGRRTVCNQKQMETKEELVTLEEVKRFMKDAMIAVGTITDHAEQLANVLVAEDHQGHLSHGLNRLDVYVSDIQKTKTTDPNVKPVILKESPSIAWVDGKHGLGPVVGNFCMKLAIKKAKSTGVGVVSAKGSNHFVTGGWYANTAQENGLIGMVFTNSSPMLVPTRAKMGVLGTNPISFCAPGKDGDSFMLDIATTAVAFGKIEVHRRKGEPIPESWALDPEGHVTTDTEVAIKTACLMPLGGEEKTSGYKGYGLSLLVETLCGILAGAAYGPCIRRWKTEEDQVANLGQCFITIDPQYFAPEFTNRMSNLMHMIRTMEPADPKKPVLVPGDAERMQAKKVCEQGGVYYHEDQLKSSDALAEKLCINKLKRKNSDNC